MSKRDDVLTAAEQMFYADGFHATSIDAVTAAARVTPRTLYHHFPSKEALVLAVLRERDARFAAWLDSHATGEPRHHAVLRALREWMAGFGARGCLFLRALGERSSPESGIAAAVEEHKARYREMIAAALGSATDAQVDEFVMVLEGVVAAAPVAGADRAFATAQALGDRIFE
ncbi:MAG: TetR/AcrR family transcriptional regulator [Pseudonocardiaceae bacterium]